MYFGSISLSQGKPVPHRTLRSAPSCW